MVENQAGCDTEGVLDLLTTVAATAGFAGLVWLAFVIEPHWASKDGRRMIARVQPLGDRDEPQGRWREMRAFIDGDIITLNSRGFTSFGLRGDYRVRGKSPHPPRRREIYILDGPQRVLLRVPSTSRAIAALDGLLD